MNIAFEAKRAFANSTGLGQYCRTLIESLAQFYSHENYFLFTPRLTQKFSTAAYPNINVITPSNFPSTWFSAAWRSSWVKKDLQQLGIQLYHGLSNEIPLGIHATGIASVVTIHDLIFERFPSHYNPIDVQIYRKKFRYACRYADAIIAISAQTKNDIVQYYNIDENKIHVCYQSCNAAFTRLVSKEEKRAYKKTLSPAGAIFLYVGSVIERKNLLTVCKKALQLLQKNKYSTRGNWRGYSV